MDGHPDILLVRQTTWNSVWRPKGELDLATAPHSAYLAPARCPTQSHRPF